MLTCLSLLAVLPHSAQAFPASDDLWAPLTLGDDVMTDPEFDVAAYPRADLVGDSDNPVAYWYLDSDNVYFRLRVNGDPAGGSYPLHADTWGLLIEVDGDTSAWDYMVNLGYLGALLQVFDNGTDDGGGAYDGADTALLIYPSPFEGAVELARVSSATGGVGSDDDFFVDIAIPLSDWEGTLGITETTTFQLAVGTTYDDMTADVFSTDFAGWDDSGGDATLADILSDPSAIDEDGDGLTYFEELELGTDPTLEDSDGDGLTDAEEVELGTLPTERDTDGDTLSDGDEVNIYGTDPFLTDSDDDGIPDAVEVDCDLGGSTDDRDDDGIPDSEEGYLDSDGDKRPDFCDDDDDNDGIPTSEEGTGNTDDDEFPDYLDDDDDDDGIPTSEEGTEDADCDGLSAYLDPDETDGPCADPDADGLTNAEEEECGTDPNDPDTDGDGILDGEESCEEDTDGDGTVDALDSTDDTDPDGSDTGIEGEQIFGLSGGHFTGGACSTLPTNHALLPALLALGAIIRRRRMALALLLPSTAVAQELDAQRFHPSVDGRNFILTDDSRVGDDGPGGSLLFNYAKDPLVYRYDDGVSEDVVLLGGVSTANFLAYYAYNGARLGVDVPVHVAANQLGVTEFGLMGDIALDGKVELFEREKDPIGLGFSARAGLPTGASTAWLGEQGFTVAPQVNLSWGPSWVAALNIGGRFGGAVDLPDEGTTWGNRLTWSAGGAIPVYDGVWLAAELDGEKIFTGDAPGGAPLEALLTLRANPMANLVATLGAGAGLTQGIGSPDARIVAGVGWMPGKRVDAVIDATGDRDGDGIADGSDNCPDQAEDMNGKADSDGCPDGDLTPVLIRVTDPGGAVVVGARVELLEGPITGQWTVTGGEMFRSLPPGQYGVRVTAEGFAALARDLNIPLQPRHEASFQLKPLLAMATLTLNVTDPDGNPVRARARILGTEFSVDIREDGVGQGSIPAGAHEVVIHSEGFGVSHRTIKIDAGGAATMDIVLKPSRVKLTADRIVILEKVFFELDSATIKPESYELLDEVVEVMLDHPEIGKVEVQGHTDDQGADEYNMELSAKRAEAVMMYLVRSGIPGERLVARGFGETTPLQPGTTEEARAANRRVEFHIVGPGTRQPGPGPGGPR